MAGLLQQGMQPQGGPQPSPQAPPGQPPQQPPPSQGGDPRVDVDPEKGNAQREVLVEAALEMLYGDQLEQVRAMLEQHAEEPHQAIGRIVAQILTVTYKQLAEQGKTVPPGVVVQVGMVVAQAVGEMAVKMKLLPEQGNADAIEAGFMLAMGEFGKATAQEMPPEQRKRYQEILQAMAQAKQGTQGGQPQQPPQGRPQPGPAQQAPRGGA